MPEAYRGHIMPLWKLFSVGLMKHLGSTLIEPVACNAMAILTLEKSPGTHVDSL